MNNLVSQNNQFNESVAWIRKNQDFNKLILQKETWFFIIGGFITFGSILAIPINPFFVLMTAPGIGIIGLGGISTLLSKTFLSKRNIKKAFDAYQRNEINNCLNLLEKANMQYENPVLINLMTEVAVKHNKNKYILKYSRKFRKYKIKNNIEDLSGLEEEHLLKIEDGIKKVDKFIKENKTSLNEIAQKSNALQNNFKVDPERSNKTVQTRYINLIKRYENLKQLISAKLNFHNKSYTNLIKLKSYHERMIILKAEEDILKQSEDKYYKETVSELALETENVANTVANENAYIQAFEELIDELNSTTNFNMFEDIQEQFKLLEQQIKFDQLN